MTISRYRSTGMHMQSHFVKIFYIWESGNPARETYIEFSILENVCLMLL